jgi:hypothetical protein
MKPIRSYVALLWMGFLFPSMLLSQSFPGLTFGGGENDAAFSFCVMQDGGYVMAGLTRSKGEGSNDFYVLKIDQFGFVEWARTFGIITQEQAFWVEATADNGVFVTGYALGYPGGSGRQDFLMLKLDANGSLEWQTLVGANLLDVGLCGKPLAGGGYAAFGISRLGDTRGNFALTRLDSEGRRVWFNVYAGNSTNYGHDFQQLPNGDFLLFGTEGGFLFPTELDYSRPNAGMLLIRTDSVGNEIWRRSIDGRKHDFGNAIHLSLDGGAYLFGSTQHAGQGSFDMYLLKIDLQGNVLMETTFGGPNWDYGTSMDIGSDGNLFLAGTTSTLGGTNTPDILVIKADADGNEIWRKTLGADSSDYGTCVRALPNGGCAVTGYSKSMGQGQKDMYFSILSADGEVVEFWENSQASPFTLVFPNPVIGSSHARVPFEYRSKAVEWRVYDLNGRLLAMRVVEQGTLPEISRQDFPAGTYLYQMVQQGKMVLQGKFVVQ